MKKRYFFSVAILFAFTATAQIVNIPDANFKAKLLEADVSNTIAYVHVWPPVNNQFYIPVKIDSNNNGEIEESEAAIIYTLDVSSSNIASLEGVNAFTGLGSLHCEFNQLTSLSLTTIGVNETNLFVYCNNNQLTEIDFSEEIGYINLDCSFNQIAGFDFVETMPYMDLNCSNNPIQSIVTGDYHKIGTLVAHNTPLSIIDITGNQYCEWVQATNCPNLTTLIFKDAVDIDADMGDMWHSFQFNNNPSLEYLCVSENRIDMAQQKLDEYGYSEVVVNSYCDFNPGAVFYNVQGNNKLDSNNNGCDTSDNAYPNLKYAITNNVVSGTIVSNDSGNFNIPVLAGAHTITPIIENPGFYTVSPPSATVNFPMQASPVTQNFCITPNGIHNDLEITLMPIGAARPGFDASYKILCKNNGTTMQTATVALTFDDALEDFVSSSPNISGQISNNLTWQLADIHPFETQSVNFEMNINSPIETPAVNLGDVLSYTAVISAATDETPQNNLVNLNQTVVNSMDPNDKTCLEGNAISQDMAGEFVHYLIRFENTGTFPAENIVVKDVIDAVKFDITSLALIEASHQCVTRFSADKVEFIFENINLPFDDANNDGYVLFKIKTKPTLIFGDTFSNTASIYFDYNHPIVTDPAVTTIGQLGTKDFDFADYFTIYPNPAGEVLQIQSKKEIAISSIQIYNTLGQLVLAVPNAKQIKSVDVSDLKTGNYFIRIDSDQGVSNSKFIKK